MNAQSYFRHGALLAAALGASLLESGAPDLLFETQAQAQQKAAPKQGEVEVAQTLNERLPDQAHAMADVGYHFANLWFAAEKQNWPLANYYLGERERHIGSCGQLLALRG
jgi:hypothetical protein